MFPETRDFSHGVVHIITFLTKTHSLMILLSSKTTLKNEVDDYELYV